MPNLEDEASLFAGATAWCTLDMLHGYYRQVPLSEDTQGMFTMVTLEGLFTPRRVPPGVLNATGSAYPRVVALFMSPYIGPITVSCRLETCRDACRRCSCIRAWSSSSWRRAEVGVEKKKQSELVSHSTGVEAACTDGFVS